MGAALGKVYGQEGQEQEYTISLDSPEGQELLKTSDIKQTLLLRIFSKQQKMGYCGIQSAAMLMSARVFGQKYPDPAQQTDCDVSNVPYVDHGMFAHAETTSIITQERALNDGSTLAEVAELLRSHGIPAQTFYAHGDGEDGVDAGFDGVEDFRARVVDALSRADSSRGVMVNYLYEATLGDGNAEEYGHHSLLAAHHEESDRFLLLDTWYNGQDTWYYTDDLYKRMNTFDDVAGRNRGFLIMGLSDD